MPASDFTRYLTASERTPEPWWQYEFPNGHHASVIPDPHHKDRPFRFEVLSTDPVDAGQGVVDVNLTTEQVEAKLTRLMNLPTRKS